MIVSFRDAWLRNFFVEDVRAKAIPAKFGDTPLQEAANVG